MKLHIDLQHSDNLNPSDAFVPDKKLIRSWLKESLKQQDKSILKDSMELSLRVVDAKESAKLNTQFRNINKATNVLSFPADVPEMIEPFLLGDLVICQPVVEQEAKKQHKKLENHWAHLIVHGCLHLLGYDHIKDSDAEEMESLEISILKKFDISNPYH